MKKALIQGTRICEFGTPFPVHKDLEWVDVADDTTEQDTYVDGEVVKYVAPVPTVLDKIIDLEAAVTPRRVRDSILTADGKTWLDDQEKLIAVERAKL